MGALKERLEAEMKSAMKSRDRGRLPTLRMLTAAITHREKEVRHELSDEEVQAVAASEVKRRKESAEAFEKGGRPELAEKERAEQAILEEYAPEQMGEDEVAALIDEAVAATGAEGPGDLGKVMGYVMGKAKGRADGGAVNRLVRERLGA